MITPAPRIEPGKNENPHLPDSRRRAILSVTDSYKANFGFLGWMHREEEAMIDRFTLGYAPNLVAALHNRSVGAIIARFNKMHNLKREKRIRMSNNLIYNHILFKTPAISLKELVNGTAGE